MSVDRKELAQRLWELSHRVELRVDPFEPEYADAAQEKWLHMADVAIAHCQNYSSFVVENNSTSAVVTIIPPDRQEIYEEYGFIKSRDVGECIVRVDDKVDGT